MKHSKLPFTFATGAAMMVSVIAIAGSRPAASASPPKPDPFAEGKRVFATNCASCHGPGIGNPGLVRKPGTDALQAKYNGELPALLEERTDLTPETVALFVRGGISIMPFYRKTEISDTELAALGAYLSRNNKELK